MSLAFAADVLMRAAHVAFCAATIFGRAESDRWAFVAGFAVVTVAMAVRDFSAILLDRKDLTESLAKERAEVKRLRDELTRMGNMRRGPTL